MQNSTTVRPHELFENLRFQRFVVVTFDPRLQFERWNASDWTAPSTTFHSLLMLSQEWWLTIVEARASLWNHALRRITIHQTSKPWILRPGFAARSIQRWKTRLQRTDIFSPGWTSGSFWFPFIKGVENVVSLHAGALVWFPMARHRKLLFLAGFGHPWPLIPMSLKSHVPSLLWPPLPCKPQRGDLKSHSTGVSQLPSGRVAELDSNEGQADIANGNGVTSHPS